MIRYIDEVFGPSGFLAQKFAGYEPRVAQIEVVRAIDDALTNGKNLLVEAPCGTGKGYAYLVPTIRHALESGASRVLVVTANNALSEQLISKRGFLGTCTTFARFWTSPKSGEKTNPKRRRPRRRNPFGFRAG